MNNVLTALTAISIAAWGWSMWLLPALEPHGSGGFGLHVCSFFASVSLFVLDAGALAFVLGRQKPVPATLLWLSAASCVLVAEAAIRISNS